ncbi:hypothetical protein OEW28_00210 [Defluviimonas sp. WL0002]|uniref:Flagellar protein FlgN n=1 Tax=Albidovulum marisflavi TaxID=2984159 RepID=A0ABT2Z8H9_9RHOB|nr:hypothetical protein [Defluviimonas sp. WL0002]MCV2867046.1 hypothetical protein [Defluviimonas sp. WL0002]
MAHDRSAIEELHELIAKQKAALRKADYASLQTLAPAVERLSSQLAAGASSLDTPTLDKLRRSLEEVRRLALASLSGLTAARNRLESLRNPQDTLMIYDAGGNVARHAGGACSIERRG